MNDCGSKHWHYIPKNILILFIKAYRLLLSPFFGNRCRFYPSCSCYAEQALEHHGLLKGVYLTICRLLKCHPFHPGGVDLVPGSETNTELN